MSITCGFPRLRLAINRNGWVAHLVWQAGADLQTARYLGHRNPGASNRRTAASLNALVKLLRDNPMTQFSIQWILSLNWLSQEWGQVHPYLFKLLGV